MERTARRVREALPISILCLHSPRPVSDSISTDCPSKLGFGTAARTPRSRLGAAEPLVGSCTTCRRGSGLGGVRVLRCDLIHSASAEWPHCRPAGCRAREKTATPRVGTRRSHLRHHGLRVTQLPKHGRLAHRLFVTRSAEIGVHGRKAAHKDHRVLARGKACSESWPRPPSRAWR